MNGFGVLPKWCDRWEEARTSDAKFVSSEFVSSEASSMMLLEVMSLVCCVVRSGQNQWSDAQGLVLSRVWRIGVTHH